MQAADVLVVKAYIPMQSEMSGGKPRMLAVDVAYSIHTNAAIYIYA